MYCWTENTGMRFSFIRWKRLDFGSKSEYQSRNYRWLQNFTLDRTGRILNAIDELYNLLLDSDDRHDLHADVMNELRDLRKRLQPIQPVQSANGKVFHLFIGNLKLFSRRWILLCTKRTCSNINTRYCTNTTWSYRDWWSWRHWLHRCTIYWWSKYQCHTS